MKQLRTRFERFCFKHNKKGIPNLMLYIVLGNALVYILSLANQDFSLYEILRFDRALILQGQLWRLVSFVFTSFGPGTNIFFTIISYICYFSLGRAMENAWGTLRFNLFYLSGVIMMDIYAMALGGITVAAGGYTYEFSAFYSGMGSYLNMSLFLGYATLYPDAHFLLFFIIPVKAWIFALLDLVMTVADVFSMTFPDNLFPHNLFPLVAILNYFLFFGKDVLNVIPLSWRINIKRLFKKKQNYAPEKAKVIPFPSAGSYQASVAKPKAPYNHRCTVCGRTDTENPDLEFRYCSKCQGYHCYCIDHISNHTHVE